ncbi:MAG: hypothetical protein JWP27_1419 [Flaviaesturariibacter sp.]|nr:hypothetical protein [Flaviaesturariibacter sp.]
MLILGIADWLEKLMLPCLVRSLTGHDCPGCGFQRSVVFLVRGDLARSVQLYWSTIPILALFTFLLLHLHFRFHWGARALVGMYGLTTILIVSQFCYKLIH